MKAKKVSKAKTDADRDLEMVKDPYRWPNWPYLPMKRHRQAGGPECMLLTATGRFELYAVFLFDLPKTPEEFKATLKYTYPTAEAMLADGWIVD